MNTESDDIDCFTKQQCLKAAVHYTVGKITEAVQHEQDVRFDRQVVAAITETVWHHIETSALNLESFARHAKRATVLADDVLLSVRNSDMLAEYLQAEMPAKKPRRETARRKRAYTDD